MLSVTGPDYRTCDGVNRRGFLKAGFLGLAGLTLADVLRLRAAQGESAKDTSVILIWKGGGPSHLDTWDLKPDAPAEYRGEFKPIKTNVSGIDIGEHLPLSAKQMDKFSIVRSVTHGDAGHESASHFLLTGYKPTNDIPSNEMPSYGSIVAKERGPNKPGLPGYIAVPTAPRSTAAAYLGVAFNPFAVGGDPNDPKFSVKNLMLPNGISMARLENRKKLLQTVDTLKRNVDQTGLIDGFDAFTRKAFEIVTSPAAQKAFDINQEDAKTRDLYGRSSLGQSMLLAGKEKVSGPFS